MKRKLYIVTIFILLFFVVLALSSCKKAEEKDYSNIKLLSLGDSIAEGILGPSPLTEREDYVYTSVLGQTNGFTYNNRSVSGHKTDQMLEYISRDSDETAYATKTHIKEADVIAVSIIGNDVLQTSLTRHVRAALQGDFTKIDRILENSYENIDGIVKRLKELNENAILIFQTVYNPMHNESELISESLREELTETLGYTDDDFYRMGAVLINRMNDVLFTYLKENPGAFYIADVNAKFDALYQKEPTRLKRLIYNDSIHPSNEGHAVIAAVLQEKLEDLGIADHDYAIGNYKELRCRQLARLYTGKNIDIKKIKKEIRAATTFNAVNEIYFNATEGIIPNAIEFNYQGKENETYTETEEEYALSSLKIWGGNLITIFDTKKSVIGFNPDGTFEFNLAVSDLGMGLLVGALQLLNGRYLPTDMHNVYLNEFFPGESFKDIVKIFVRIKNDLGLEIVGLDKNDPKIKRIIDTMSETGCLPEKIEIPTDFKLIFRLSGRYSLHKIKIIDGSEMQGIYIGNYTDNGEPYVIMTKTDDGIKLVNEVLNLEVVFKE